MGSLTFTSTGLNMTVFDEADCQGHIIRATLFYGQDMSFFTDTNYTQGMNFTSFNISRPLEEQEQLDISKTGQDAGQTQVWSCGAFETSYLVGTAAGCQTLANGVSAGCVRLWHY